jgi:flagellar biosynthesis protein FlhB
MNERIKKIIKVALFAFASAFFLYSGFSMLIEESNKDVIQIERK